ncbi:MAG: hypothetical protein RML94_05405 [Bacteroidia bacterium]|nr:hypothetical protein [Bacteroidia bacterium]
MGVSLAALRVGVLRATLMLRCFAALRTADAPSACLTQEPRQVGSVYLFKLLFCKYLKMNIKQDKNKLLPCKSLKINSKQGKTCIFKVKRSCKVYIFKV